MPCKKSAVRFSSPPMLFQRPEQGGCAADALCHGKAFVEGQLQRRRGDEAHRAGMAQGEPHDGFRTDLLLPLGPGHAYAPGKNVRPGYPQGMGAGLEIQRRQEESSSRGRGP